MEKFRRIMCSRAFLLLLGSCGGGERRVAPFGWSAVSPEADTLTLGLEWSFMNDLTDPEAALECSDCGPADLGAQVVSGRGGNAHGLPDGFLGAESCVFRQSSGPLPRHHGVGAEPRGACGARA